MNSIKYLGTTILSATILFFGCEQPKSTTAEKSAAQIAQPVAASQPTSESAASQPTTAEAAALEFTTANRRVLSSGVISGMNGHHSSGTVQVVEEAGKFYVRMTEDFTFDSAPLPIVALGNNGYKKETATVKLKTNKGASDYELPAGTNVENYNEVIIWCEKFSVPISKASLAKP